MHPVVVDKPYAFVPPHLGTWWPRFLQLFLRRGLRWEFGVVDIKCRGLERLRESLSAGHGVLLTPNHCRPCDPGVVCELCRQAGTTPLIMASWHLFMQGRLKAFLLRRVGAFSVYREGLDRQALQAGIDILQQARRPLVIFPEGAITRTNDRLVALMEGPSFIAKAAAKRRAEAAGGGQVVIHPVAIKYFSRRSGAGATFRLGRYRAALVMAAEAEGRPVRADLQGRRVAAVFEGIGVSRSTANGSDSRARRAADRSSPGTAGTRMAQRSPREDSPHTGQEAADRDSARHGGGTDHGRRTRTPVGQLADMYLAQQMSHYPPEYIKSKPTPERMLETVERFEEDLTDVCRVYSPMTAMVQVGKAIPVSPAREGRTREDPLMATLEARLRSMLEELAEPTSKRS